MAPYDPVSNPTVPDVYGFFSGTHFDGNNFNSKDLVLLKIILQAQQFMQEFH